MNGFSFHIEAYTVRGFRFDLEIGYDKSVLNNIIIKHLEC